MIPLEARRLANVPRLCCTRISVFKCLLRIDLVCFWFCDHLLELLNHRLHVVQVPHRWYALEEKEHGVNQLRVIGGVYDCCLRTGMHMHNDYCGFTSLHPVLLQQVEGKMGYSEILEMVDHIKRFLMVLSFNKNKWLQCTLCQKHYGNDLR